MKRETLKTVLCLSLAFVFAFAAYSQSDPFGKCKVVAKNVNGLTVCDKSLLNEPITIPLSALTEELQIVKLDDSDAALVKGNMTEISDNYILVAGSGAIPYKLFDRKTGKFLNNIGARGQGPGEYTNVCDQVLDEKNNRIYLLPWGSRKILAYDLKGNVLDPVRLPMEVPKGKIFANSSSGTVSVFAVPWTGSPYVAWTQKISGEVIGGIAPVYLSIDPRNSKGQFRGFNFEINSGKNISDMDMFLMNGGERLDTLYHYDAKAYKLLPRFAVNYKDAKLPGFAYFELPKYYMGVFWEEKQISANVSEGVNYKFFVVEKSTLKGNYFTLENDFLGNIEIGWPSYAFNNGYYVYNADPGNLHDALEKILNSGKKLTPEMRTKLTKLKDSITDNDNNYILYAKLKK